MIIINIDQSGKCSTTIKPDVPSDFESAEWKAYNAACDRAEAAGELWTEEQAATWHAYRQAQLRKEQHHDL